MNGERRQTETNPNKGSAFYRMASGKPPVRFFLRYGHLKKASSAIPTYSRHVGSVDLPPTGQMSRIAKRHPQPTLGYYKRMNTTWTLLSSRKQMSWNGQSKSNAGIHVFVCLNFAFLVGGAVLLHWQE